MQSFSDSIVYEFLFQNPVQYPMRAFSHSTEFWKHYLFVFPMQLSCLYCLWLQDGINSSQCLACYHNQWLHLFQWFIASGCIVLLQLLKFVCMWHCRHCHPEQSMPKSLASSVVDLYLYLMIAWSRSIFNSCFLPPTYFIWIQINSIWKTPVAGCTSIPAFRMFCFALIYTLLASSCLAFGSPSHHQTYLYLPFLPELFYIPAVYIESYYKYIVRSEKDFIVLWKFTVCFQFPPSIKLQFFSNHLYFLTQFFFW